MTKSVGAWARFIYPAMRHFRRKRGQMLPPQRPGTETLNACVSLRRARLQALLLCAVVAACSPAPVVQAQGSAVKDWRVHAGNPVIQAGSMRERAIWNDPSVLRLADGQLAMYLTSSTVEPFKPPILPFRAVSRDGLSWTLDPAGPLLTTAGTPYINIETPTVVRFRGRWHMYFMGVLAPGSVPASHIGHAVSDDGLRWQLDPQGIQAVAATGKVSDWNGFLVSEPGAVVFKDRIYLYFHALGARPGGKPPQLSSIGLATTDDGTHFSPAKPVLTQSEALFPPAAGYAGYATVSAAVHEGRVHLFYNVVANPKLSGSDIEQVALHHSVSDDGETAWRQDPKPIFQRSDFDWTEGGIISPTVLIEDGKVKMWFAGHMSKLSFVKLMLSGWKGRQFGIGYAETPLDSLARARP